MDLIDDTIIDLSGFCPELQKLYLSLRPHMTVRVNRYVPGIGVWSTVWQVIDDEMIPLREGRDQDVFRCSAPVINGSLADLHRRITEDRLSVILSYTDHTELSLLWELLIESKDMGELVSNLNQITPDVTDDTSLYDEQKEMEHALNESKHWIQNQKDDMLKKRLAHFEQPNSSSEEPGIPPSDEEWTFSDSSSEIEDWFSGEEELEELTDAEKLREARLARFG